MQRDWPQMLMGATVVVLMPILYFLKFNGGYDIYIAIVGIIMAFLASALIGYAISGEQAVLRHTKLFYLMVSMSIIMAILIKFS